MEQLIKNNKILTRWSTALSILFTVLMMMFSYSVGAQAQAQPVQIGGVADKNPLLEWLPGVTFMFSIIIGILNLWVINKLNKSKDDILSIVRGELNAKVSSIEDKAATKEQLDFFRKEVKLMLINIEQKIDLKYKGKDDI